MREKGYWGGFLTGVIVGAASALLMAPRRGEEIREELAESAGKLGGKATEAAGSLAQTATSAVQEARGKASDALAQASEKGAQALEVAQSAASQAGENAARALESAKAAAGDVREGAGQAAAALGEAAAQAAGGVKEAAAQAASDVKEAASQSASTVKEAVAGAIDEAGDTLSGATYKASDTATEGGNGQPEPSQSTGEAIAEAVAEAPSSQHDVAIRANDDEAEADAGADTGADAQASSGFEDAVQGEVSEVTVDADDALAAAASELDDAAVQDEAQAMGDASLSSDLGSDAPSAAAFESHPELSAGVSELALQDDALEASSEPSGVAHQASDSPEASHAFIEAPLDTDDVKDILPPSEGSGSDDTVAQAAKSISQGKSHGKGRNKNRK